MPDFIIFVDPAAQDAPARRPRRDGGRASVIGRAMSETGKRAICVGEATIELARGGDGAERPRAAPALIACFLFVLPLLRSLRKIAIIMGIFQELFFQILKPNTLGNILQEQEDDFC